eukprot:Gb_29539 [translate_table: standard]
MVDAIDEIRCPEFGKHHEVAIVENTVLDKEESFSVSDLTSSVSGSITNTLNENNSNIDIEYLLSVTDDEFGIPPSPRSDLIKFAEQKNGDMATAQEQSVICRCLSVFGTSLSISGAEVFHGAEISMELLEELALPKGLLGPLSWKLIAIGMEAHHARFGC